jgi:two-component system, NtrC family, nitrogen regulation sensor histidine kinase NtrY
LISRNFYINIVIRVVLITLVALFTAWSVISKMPYLFIVTGIIAIVSLTAGLIFYINSTNRRISYFFESVKNEDSALSFPSSTNDRRVKEISGSLNRINNQIRQLRIESRQQEQYLQALIEHVPTGIITFNNNGFILHANSAAKKMFSVDVLTHLKQLERVDRRVFQTIQNIKPSEQQLVSMTSERGTVQLSLKAASFKTGNEELTLLSIQDIRNELDEKELDSWMKIIRVMMHEIINSISPIASLSESLTKLYSEGGKPVKPEKINEKTIETTLQGLGVIKDQGNGLMSFIDSYRKLTRLPKPEKKIIRIEDLLSRVTVLFPTFESNNRPELTISCNPSDIEVFADETQITLCLINIIKNAIQANNKNPDGRIHIAVGIENSRPEITVTDNGPGIQPEILEEIFVPFFTTRDEGSGIGLSISRQIMRLHGGSLSAKSIPGKETIFKITF